MSVTQLPMKLTLVNVSYNGKQHQEFIMCRMEDGKAVLSMERLNKILDKLGCRNRGATFSIG